MAAHPIDYRYGSNEMRAIFDEESRLAYYLQVEAALARALAAKKAIPQKAAQAITKAATPKVTTLARVKEFEAHTKHDVMAVAKALAEASGPEAGKYVHYTATSYDIVDTALSLQLRDGLALLLRQARTLLLDAIALSERHADTLMIGRTHGQHALPITFGFKMANYAHALGMSIQNLRWDAQNIVFAKFSGAVGSYASGQLAGLSADELEILVAKEVGLPSSPISTQVVSRTYLARILCDIAILCSAVEQMAAEIRNLQRTEISEVSEPFASTQVGSSTMAQKRNPIHCENICGNVRIIRSLVSPALEDIALEHERDLTNSAAERSIVPTAFLLADEVLTRMHFVLSGLQVNEKRMKENMNLTNGAVMAEAVMTELVRKGMDRSEAHEILRVASSHTNARVSLQDVLSKNPVVNKHLSQTQLHALFDASSYVGECPVKARDIARKWKEEVKTWD